MDMLQCEYRYVTIVKNVHTSMRIVLTSNK